MSQKVLDKTVIRTPNKKSGLKDLKSDIGLLRSAIVSMLGEDDEGKYNPKFVNQILKTTKDTPTHSFHNAKSFLAELHEV